MPMHRWRFSYRIFLIVFLVYLTHNIRTIHAQYTHNKRTILSTSLAVG